MTKKPRRRKGSTATAPDKWFATLEGCEIGGYTLLDYVGCGKVGHVYRGRSKSLQGMVHAIKLIPGQPRKGWKTELSKVALLANVRNVVHLHALGSAHVDKGDFTQVFQWTAWDYIAPGKDLRKYLEERDSCPTSLLIAVLECVLHVLHACNQKDVPRHGDLHAGNILIGAEADADLDDSLEPRLPVYVSDFGYGATGLGPAPKDDYRGLADITNEVLRKVDWERASAADRQCVQSIRQLVLKLLNEERHDERLAPIAILKILRDFRYAAQTASPVPSSTPPLMGATSPPPSLMNVGQFQVSEMLGADWAKWRQLFVAGVPARSRVLEPDISTVVTGPRGCGKTMLFRRLSERLLVECGPVGTDDPGFVGFYVNANDLADAFAYFPLAPSAQDAERLICYAHLCLLADILAVLAAKDARGEKPPEGLLVALSAMLGAKNLGPLISRESRLERLRTALEDVKWRFPRDKDSRFPACNDMGRHDWLRVFLPKLRTSCPWIAQKPILWFVDDYTTPRVSAQMQRVLNRTVFQRSAEFVCKIATESASTFVAEDASGKVLQDGDDYQLIDMGEESLFMGESERQRFLAEVFSRRLSLDPRVPEHGRTLVGLLGRLDIGKTEFARRLREVGPSEQQGTGAHTKRKGAARARVLYHGADVLGSMWSGDTRMMIQLVQDVLGETEHQAIREQAQTVIAAPIPPEIQDRAFRNRGGHWLDSQARCAPTDQDAVERYCEQLRDDDSSFSLAGGTYGTHLKAVVEAFVAAARTLLMGPTYSIGEAKGPARQVPRMAFRIEVLDEFRLHGLSAEIYKDLIRYGLFMRDARGKSVRGAMVPRLYLRRLLLPYCTLALSKRDSVPLTCEALKLLLLRPDTFREQYTPRRSGSAASPQTSFTFIASDTIDPMYDDLEEDVEQT